MKEFNIPLNFWTSIWFDHFLSIPLRTIMCIDLPRVDYDKGKKVKKSDYDFVREQNRKLAEKKKDAK